MRIGAESGRPQTEDEQSKGHDGRHRYCSGKAGLAAASTCAQCNRPYRGPWSLMQPSQQDPEQKRVRKVMQHKSCNAEQAATQTRGTQQGKNKGVAHERAHPTPSSPGLTPGGGPSAIPPKPNTSTSTPRVGGRSEQLTPPLARGGGCYPPSHSMEATGWHAAMATRMTVVRARCGVPTNHISQPPALALAAARNTETARIHLGAPGHRHGATGG